MNKVMRHSLGSVLAKLGQRHPEAKETLDVDVMIRIREEVFRQLKGKTVNLEEIRREASAGGQLLNFLKASPSSFIDASLAEPPA